MRRQVPDIYVRRTFEYVFPNDEERRAYRKRNIKEITRRMYVNAAIYAFFATVAQLPRYLLGSDGIEAVIGIPVGMVIGAIIGSVVSMATSRKDGMVVVLEGGWIAVFGFRGATARHGWSPAVRFPAKSIKAARWTPEGCRLMGQFSGKGVLIDRRLLDQRGAVEALVDWCEKHGIQMEGIRPLPDGTNPYSTTRPLEG